MPEPRDDFADLPALARFGVQLEAAARRDEGRPSSRRRRWLRGGALGLTLALGATATAAATVAALRGTELRAGAHGVVLAVLPGRPVAPTRYAGTLRTASGATRHFAYPVHGGR